ncbi:MAG TPA: ATP-dependent helicase, partial [Ktedonobacteraceae bacterium]|nr:ATP-dependent helicase [Ktedonobacteraceae bacterium]
MRAVEIAPALIKAAGALNDEQREIVAHKSGPLLVVAGPGSGKTRSLTFLAMNLLLCRDAEPSQIVLCTYTEKAAYELQDRLTRIAGEINYPGDISQLRVGTIHGICQRLVNEYLHHTSLGSGYEMLDNFTQQLLIFDHLAEICPKNTLPFFQDRWGTPWEIAKRLKFYFDTIAEELVFEKLKNDIERLKGHKTRDDILLHYLTHAYNSYCVKLRDTNSTDFAHLQKWAYKLLTTPDTFQKITSDIRYVLVDEYQDTNYIQEQILIFLASGSESKNLVVIGDEDQALYRFRGATVRNILTFTQKFPDCREIHLTINYRSQAEIISACNRWIEDFDWSNGDGPRLRTAKTMRAGSAQRSDQALLRLDAVDIQDEAEQFADLVAKLKEQGKIDDYSDVALLLHSVRFGMSDKYIDALNAKNIPYYCPRARAFFDQSEVKIMLGCFARILRYSADTYSPLKDTDDFSEYL